MKNTSKKRSKQLHEYPPVITALPEASMPFPSVKAWTLQAEEHQLIFFEFQPTVKVPAHSHSYAQWGILIQGKMKLTINNKTKTITKGQEYLIPAQAKHSVQFLAKTRVIDFFSERTRYKTKTAK